MTEPMMTAALGGPVSEDSDFERFYARWHPTVCRWALQKYGATYADEIAQETLSRAFVNFRQLRRELPWPWLLTVARNVACDLHRTAIRCSGHPSQGLIEHPDPYPGPEEIAVRTDVSQRVRDAMRAMPLGDRELLNMAVDDMSIAEMADALGTSQGAIRVRLHRARKRLGHLYVAKGGNLAVTPIGALGWALRKLRRGVQQAVPAAAPTTALLAATATVATIGAVVAGIPAVDLGHRHVRQAAVVHRSGASSRPGQHAKATSPVVTRTLRGGTASTAAPQVSASSGDAAPVGASAAASIGKDPSHKGGIHDQSIRLTTPIGAVYVKGATDRGSGSGLACITAAVSCN